MKAAILSPGPSLPKTWQGGADVVIAVNRAALAHKCDYWACGDLPALQENVPKLTAKPHLFTAEVSLNDFRGQGGVWNGPITTFEDLFPYLHPGDCGCCWTFLTALAAIVLAASIGASEIDCYGYDWTGTADYDGVEAGANRSDDRWRDECGRFGALQKIF